MSTQTLFQDSRENAKKSVWWLPFQFGCGGDGGDGKVKGQCGDGAVVATIGERDTVTLQKQR